jgi:hypothetical protein
MTRRRVCRVGLVVPCGGGIWGCVMVQLGSGIGSGPCLAGEDRVGAPAIGLGCGAGMLAAGQGVRLWGL